MNSAKRQILAFAFTLLLIQLFTADVEACTCSLNPDPPCRAVGEADAVFEAEVLRREKVEPDTDGYYRRRFTMKVRKAYKGSLADAVYVYTGRGDSDCGYRFEVGARYIVYAYEHNGRLSASTCTRTREIENAKDDIAYFRQLPAMPAGVTIYGKVVKAAEVKGKWQHVAMPGIEIEIEMGTKEKRTVMTEADGGFRLSGLVPGKYQVRAILPEALKLSVASYVDLYPYPVYVENVPDKGCIETYFVLEPKAKP